MGARRRMVVLACALATVAVATEPASAASRAVAAAQAVERTCQARLLPSGTAGSARWKLTPTSSGVARLRLSGSRGDWDLALFDAGSGGLLSAAATYGPREVVDAPVAAGRQVVAQACRRTGGGRDATLSFGLHGPPAGESDGRAQLVSVPLDAIRTHARLEATGLDVTHDVAPGHATVVVYSAAERSRLAAAGFAPTTVISDMRVDDLIRARTDARFARLTAASALPSQRDSYRTLADYGTDLKAIVDQNPTVARRIEIGASLEGRPLEGVELAGNVGGRDGRPFYVVMGLHHAREWPSGEMPMELAVDLARNYGKSARITNLLDRVRVIVLPVVNPDGFNVSRTAGPTPFDDDEVATLPFSLSDAAAYKRKNCRPAAGSEAGPCMSRPAAQGVDLNRNYGAYWGGVGSSDAPTVQNYRGTEPYSEPEAQAVHNLSSTRSIVTIITHHTFTDQGIWLRQPGFCDVPPNGCQRAADLVPDEAGMKGLGDAMGDATDWQSDLGWVIGEITGATEDWNYFTQGAYGYTPEQRGPNFHPNFQSAVVAEYLGTTQGAAGGVREALLRGGEQAANPSFHSLLLGSAPPGRVLRLRKAFQTPTKTGPAVDDKLDFTTTVPDSGFYTWHVNQSTRPLSNEPEAYTLTCETPGGGVEDTHAVVIARGQTVATDLACGEPAALASSPTPLTRAARAACADVRAPLTSPTRGSLRVSRTRVRLRGRARDAGCRAGRGLVERPGALARVLVAVARAKRGRCAFVGPSGRLGTPRSCGRPRYVPAKGLSSWSLTLGAQLPPGRYQAWTRAVDAAGNTESRRRRVVGVTLR